MDTEELEDLQESEDSLHSAPKSAKKEWEEFRGLCALGGGIGLGYVAFAACKAHELPKVVVFSVTLLSGLVGAIVGATIVPYLVLLLLGGGIIYYLLKALWDRS